MNSKNLGIALTSEKIIVTNKPVSISEKVYTYVEQEARFINGGRLPIQVGDVMRGTANGGAAIIVKVEKKNGEWADNNVEGSLRFKSVSGCFLIEEVISVGGEADKVTLIDEPYDCKDEYKYKGAHAKIAFISVKPTTDSMVDHAAIFIAPEGSNLDHNFCMGHVIPEAKKWVLYGNEIEKAKFLNFIQGSKAVLNVTCYFGE